MQPGLSKFMWELHAQVSQDGVHVFKTTNPSHECQESTNSCAVLAAGQTVPSLFTLSNKEHLLTTSAITTSSIRSA
jgi:hypothetical protein